MESPRPRGGIGIPEHDGVEPESLASWLGINRATLAVLVVIGGLGMAEEVWKPFMPLHLRDAVGQLLPAAEKGDVLLEAVKYTAILAFLVNLLEGFGYIIGGTVAHRMGPRVALAVSALPMLIGFTILRFTNNPWAIVGGGLLLTNWEPLSVPATFDVVGSEVPKERRTIAFAVQSIQKRVPKMLGPWAGGLLMACSFLLNLYVAIGLVILSVIFQAALLKRMKPKAEPAPVPLRQVLREMPPDLRALLSAEIFLRWGDWFIRDFALLYVVSVLGRSEKEAGFLVGLTSFAALATYIPVGKLVDRAPSPKPFIGLTFFLFALFPLNMVWMPLCSRRLGIPVMAALVAVFLLNGLRELGEPARKALISASFPKEYRARAVGLYWGLRSFAFCAAPLLAWLLWKELGPEAMFLIGGAIGMYGTARFWLRVRCQR
ncbi:MAG: MFS transporter [Planctomycetota bacterium]